VNRRFYYATNTLENVGGRAAQRSVLVASDPIANFATPRKWAVKWVVRSFFCPETPFFAATCF